MSEMDSSQGNMPVLQRVRCGQCHLPLVQFYQGNPLTPPQQRKGEMTSQSVSPYSYRSLTDPLPLCRCPRCGAMLSPTAVTPVRPGMFVTEEGGESLHGDD